MVIREIFKSALGTFKMFNNNSFSKLPSKNSMFIHLVSNDGKIFSFHIYFNSHTYFNLHIYRIKKEVVIT